MNSGMMFNSDRLNVPELIQNKHKTKAQSSDAYDQQKRTRKYRESSTSHQSKHQVEGHMSKECPRNVNANETPFIYSGKRAQQLAQNYLPTEMLNYTTNTNTNIEETSITYSPSRVQQLAQNYLQENMMLNTQNYTTNSNSQETSLIYTGSRAQQLAQMHLAAQEIASQENENICQCHLKEKPILPTQKTICEQHNVQNLQSLHPTEQNNQILNNQNLQNINQQLLKTDENQINPQIGSDLPANIQKQSNLNENNYAPMNDMFIENPNTQTFNVSQTIPVYSNLCDQNFNITIPITDNLTNINKEFGNKCVLEPQNNDNQSALVVKSNQNQEKHDDIVVRKLSIDSRNSEKNALNFSKKYSKDSMLPTTQLNININLSAPACWSPGFHGSKSTKTYSKPVQKDQTVAGKSQEKTSDDPKIAKTTEKQNIHRKPFTCETCRRTFTKSSRCSSRSSENSRKLTTLDETNLKSFHNIPSENHKKLNTCACNKHKRTINKPENESNEATTVKPNKCTPSNVTQDDVQSSTKSNMKCPKHNIYPTKQPIMEPHENCKQSICDNEEDNVQNVIERDTKNQETQYYNQTRNSHCQTPPEMFNNSINTNTNVQNISEKTNSKFQNYINTNNFPQNTQKQGPAELKVNETYNTSYQEQLLYPTVPPAEPMPIETTCCYQMLNPINMPQAYHDQQCYFDQELTSKELTQNIKKACSGECEEHLGMQMQILYSNESVNQENQGHILGKRPMSPTNPRSRNHNGSQPMTESQSFPIQQSKQQIPKTQSFPASNRSANNSSKSSKFNNTPPKSPSKSGAASKVQRSQRDVDGRYSQKCRMFSTEQTKRGTGFSCTRSASPRNANPDGCIIL